MGTQTVGKKARRPRVALCEELFVKLPIIRACPLAWNAKAFFRKPRSCRPGHPVPGTFLPKRHFYLPKQRYTAEHQENKTGFLIESEGFR